MQIEILTPRGARDKERQRKSHDQTDCGGCGGERNGAQQDRAVERVDEAAVAFPRPGKLDAAVGSAREQAIGADDGERSQEKQHQPEPCRQQKPEPQAVHQKCISSACFHQTCMGSPTR